jgi:hypothetical protein
MIPGGLPAGAIVAMDGHHKDVGSSTGMPGTAGRPPIFFPARDVSVTNRGEAFVKYFLKKTFTAPIP